MAEKMTARAITDLAKFLAGILAKGGSAKALAEIGKAARLAMKDILKFGDALEDLRRQTGGSYREAEKLLGYYNRLAKELGATTLQVKEAADAWQRQGKSAAQAGELARQAILRARGEIERGGLAPLERLEERTNRLRAAFESLSMEPLADAAGIDAAAGVAALLGKAETDKIKPIAEASLRLDERYQGLPAQLKNALDAAAGNLDTAFYQSFQGDVSAMAQWFSDNLIGPLEKNAGQVRAALAAAFAVDDALAAGGAKVKSYLAQVEGAAAAVFGAFGQEQRQALAAKGLGAADMAGLFGFGQYARQAREMMDGVSAALGAPVARQLLESLDYSQLQTLCSTIRDIAAQGEDASRYAGMFLRAYTDPQLAGPLNALGKTLENGQVSQEAFNQKVRELGEAAGFAGPVLERFDGLFSQAPGAVAGFNQSLDGAQEKLHGFAGIDSFFTAVGNAYDTPQMDEVAADIQQVNRQLQEGAIAADAYFDALAGRVASFSWEGLRGDAGAQAMFTGLAMATAQGLEFIDSQFAGGSLDVGQYTRALGEATENLLQMLVATENLSQGQDGLWRDSTGQVDEYANALAASLEGLQAFAPMVDVLTANAGY